MTLLLMSIGVFALALAVLLACRTLGHAIRDCQVSLVRLEQGMLDLAVDEHYRRIRRAARLEQAELVEKTVEAGVSSTETIHESVADVTFRILDSIPAIKGISGLVRGVHDGIAGTAYTSVRVVNEEIGGLAKDHVKRAGEQPEGADPDRRK